MKASAFLKLVGEMRAEQNSFFAKRGKYPIEARDHLIQAKTLEKQVDAVVRDGRLEPDEPTTVTTTEPTESQLQLDLDNAIATGRYYEPDANDLLAG